MHSFSADPHDTHDRIIGFRNRPRADVTEMYARLPEEGRTRVQPDSGLWILGNFGRARQRREVRTSFHAFPRRT